MSDDEIDAQTKAQLQRGLRIATTIVAVAIVCGLGLLNLLRRRDSFDLLAAQLIAFAALVAVLAVTVVLVVRRTQWGPMRRVAIGVVFAAAALSYLTLPDGRTSTATDWIFGAANWVGLVVLLDRPFRTTVAFLAAHELLAFANLLLFHDVTRSSLARFATGSVSVLGFPLCVAVVAAVLGRIGKEAAAATRELERVRTEEAVAVATHRRRGQRFAELADTAVPLLEGLADGSRAPSDPVVRRDCAIEASRMRRLFAETDTVENPLLHELRHCADIADRKGVEVELDARGQAPRLPVAVRRDLTDAALTALATASSWARVTLVGSADLVSVSVVADCAEERVPVPVTPDVRIETFGSGGTIWTEAQWQPTMT
ncbi:hypothetical protein [Actinophytocola sediminis]